MNNLFPTRLAATIAALSAQQLDRLRVSAPDASGPYAMVAAACGMRNQSILSDILSGRMPGTKYRAALARILGVDVAWLEGTGGEPPDWSLSPLQAWKRFTERLRRQSGSVAEEISSHPNAQSQRRAIVAVFANTYGLDIGSAEARALADGRYAELPFDLVLRHASQSGLAEPTHPDHLADGQTIWVHMQTEIERETAAARERLLRYLPPPLMFERFREAVLAQQACLDRESMADMLELLWRQSQFREHQSRTSVPARFQTDTGRQHWTRLSDIQQRWS